MLGEPQAPWVVRLIPQAVACGIALGAAAAACYLIPLGLDYYRLPIALQGAHPLDALLRSSGRYGLALGLAAAGLMLLNVLYLIRRNLRPDQLTWLGSPRAWMTIHVATGLAAPVVALLHSGFTLRTPLGASALGCLGAAALAGLVGRYLYSVVPRGASGRELQLAQVRGEAQQKLDLLERQLGADPQVDAMVQALLDEPVIDQRGSWIGARIVILAAADLRRRRVLSKLQRRMGRNATSLRLLALLGDVLRLRLQSRQHEELHRLMASWRGAHRWLALLTTLLLLGHVYVAVSYAQLW